MARGLDPLRAAGKPEKLRLTELDGALYRCLHACAAGTCGVKMLGRDRRGHLLRHGLARVTPAELERLFQVVPVPESPR